MVSRVIALDVEPRNADCELEQLNSIPSSGARDLGIIRLSGGVSDSSLKADDALKFVHQRACEMGADAIMIEQKQQGQGDSAQYHIVAHAIAYPQSSGQAGPTRDQQHDNAEATRARTVEIPDEAGEHAVEVPKAPHTRMVEIPTNAEAEGASEARDSGGPDETPPEASSAITESSIPASAAAPLEAPHTAARLAAKPASVAKRFATEAGMPSRVNKSAVASTARPTSTKATSSIKTASAKAVSTAIAGSPNGIPSALATPKMAA
jgi:hypothetical protein